MRAPCGATPPDPRGGAVYVVSYVNTAGETVTLLRRTRAAALRLAREVADRGGSPRVHRAQLARCDEVPPW